jgi:hypothetical protein
VITARMKGWKTRTFTEKNCIHHRPIGTAGHHPMAARFRVGLKDYAVGNHPVWELCRVARQMALPPRCVGGLALGAGYVWALLRRTKRPVPPELIEFHRGEQMQRLFSFLRRRTSPSTEMPWAREPNIGKGTAD